MSVIEWEIEYLSKILGGMVPDDRDFFESKIESLNFAKGSIETNVSTGITSMDAYVDDVRKYKVQSEMQLKEAIKTLGSANSHVERLKKRVELCQAEIGEMDTAEIEAY